MTERSTHHATFVTERTYPASPARVFKAWAEPRAKARWFDMHLDEERISVSLATVEFEPADAGTRLIYTEQAVFLDGLDTPAQREHGMRALLDSLDAALRREPAKESKR